MTEGGVAEGGAAEAKTGEGAATAGVGGVGLRKIDGARALVASGSCSGAPAVCGTE